MSNLICPFCQQELEKRHAATTDYNSMFITYYCGNPECESTTDLIGCKEFWDILGQLIRTRRALEWARHFLKEIRLRYLFEKDNPSRQNKWADTALCMYNFAEEFFDDYDKTNENKGGDNE